MSDPITTDRARDLEPVRIEQAVSDVGFWTGRLVFFLRTMAMLSMLKGLYHWAQVCGIGISADRIFEARSTPWQSATVFFAVIDLAAAVGLWLAAPWGAVVWLTAVVSMIAVEILFPQVYGYGIAIVAAEFAMLIIYLWLALKSAREHSE